MFLFFCEKLNSLLTYNKKYDKLVIVKSIISLKYKYRKGFKLYEYNIL